MIWLWLSARFGVIALRTSPLAVSYTYRCWSFALHTHSSHVGIVSVYGPCDSFHTQFHNSNGRDRGVSLVVVTLLVGLIHISRRYECDSLKTLISRYKQIAKATAGKYELSNTKHTSFLLSIFLSIIFTFLAGFFVLTRELYLSVALLPSHCVSCSHTISINTMLGSRINTDK